jgi:hypothetical protein
MLWFAMETRLERITSKDRVRRQPDESCYSKRRQESTTAALSTRASIVHTEFKRLVLWSE